MRTSTLITLALALLTIASGCGAQRTASVIEAPIIADAGPQWIPAPNMISAYDGRKDARDLAMDAGLKVYACDGNYSGTGSCLVTDAPLYECLVGENGYESCRRRVGTFGQTCVARHDGSMARRFTGWLCSEVQPVEVAVAPQG